MTSPQPKISVDDNSKLLESLIDDPLIKIALTCHRPSRGDQCLNFDNRPWLVDIYRCKAQEMVAQKCVQVGLTEYLFVRTFHSAGNKGLGVLYMLPTLDLRNRVVKARVNPAIQKSDYYKHIQRNSSTDSMSRAKVADATEVKLFGKAPIYFVGSNSPSGVVECAVDLVIIDEVDKCDSERVAMAFDRYSSSMLKESIKVGNPSFPDRGISAAFKASNQQYWLIRCDGCRKWQDLDWFRHVVREVGPRKYELRDREWKPGCGRDIAPMCQSCEKPLNRFARGRWVAKYPDRPVVGFTMSQLYSPTTTLERLMYNLDQGFLAALGDEYRMQLFFNSVLGLPYSPAGTSLSELVIRGCAKDYALPNGSHRPTTMGVDVGASKLNVRISDRPTRDGRRYRRMLYEGTVAEFEELTPLMQRYNVAIGVIDIDPETRKAKEFQAKHDGKIWLCSVVDPPTRSAVEAFKFDDETRIVTAHRTQMMDAMVSEYINGTAIVPDNFAKLEGGAWLAQMCASKRMLDEQAKPPRYRWDADRRPDHYAFADNYDLVAGLLLDRGYNSSLAAHPDFLMGASHLEQDQELADAEEMEDLLFPERRKKKRAKDAEGGDDWSL